MISFYTHQDISIPNMSYLGAEDLILTVPNPAAIGPLADTIVINNLTATNTNITNITATNITATNLAILGPIAFGGLILETNVNGAGNTATVRAATGLGNANLALVPEGTGAIVADIPDNAATGGNTRGTAAVDLQITRAASTQVASGNQSAILAGTNNTASGTTSGVLVGSGNTASNTSAVVIGGQNNNASGINASVLAGNDNNSTSTGAVVIGGNTNTSSQISSVVVGGSNNSITGGGPNFRSAIVGGSLNSITGDTSLISASTSSATSGGASFIIGGSNHTITTSNRSGVLGGFLNQIGGGTGGIIIGGQVNTMTNSTYGVILGSDTSSCNGNYSIVAGGTSNAINAGCDRSMILGDDSTIITSTNVVAVGSLNSITNSNSAIAVGNSNQIINSARALAIGRGADINGGTESHYFKSSTAAATPLSATNTCRMQYDAMEFIAPTHFQYNGTMRKVVVNTNYVGPGTNVTQYTLTVAGGEAYFIYWQVVGGGGNTAGGGVAHGYGYTRAANPTGALTISTGPFDGGVGEQPGGFGFNYNVLSGLVNTIEFRITFAGVLAGNATRFANMFLITRV